MAVKLKRGRLWFIACKTPIPYPPRSATPPRPGVVRVGGPTLRPLRQPLYDATPSSPAPVRNLFQVEAYAGGYGYYWSTSDGEEVIWRLNWDQALGFDTKDEAEIRAFDVAIKFPHLIGKLTVMKLKVRFRS